MSGVAALVLARNPAFSTAQIKGRLLASTDAKASLTSKTVSGGRINAFKAVSATTANRPPVANAGPNRTVKPGSNVTFAGVRAPTPTASRSGIAGSSCSARR